MTSFPGTESALNSAKWIRPIPSTWRYIRLKWTISSSKNGVWGDEPDGGNDDIVCIRVADFDRSQLSTVAVPPTSRRVERSQRHGRLLKFGDLLLEKSGGGDKQPVGALVSYSSTEPGVCSNFIARLVPARGQHCRYLTYLHASLYFQRVNLRSIKQTTGIQNLDQEMYLDEVVAIPPFEAQRAIADFLDRKTAAIDALIEKKERLIALLAEKRAALIHRAVTKGLNPNAPMKDSGIPWIGEIPAHWRVVQLRRVVQQLDQGWSPVAYDQDRQPEEWGVLKLSAVKGGRYDPSHSKVLPAHERPLPALVPRRGDLLITRANTPDLVGDSCVVEREDPRTMLCDLIYRVRLSKHALPGFVDLYLRSSSGRLQIQADARGSSQSMAKISPGHLLSWQVPLAPVDEQSEIVAALVTVEASLRAGVERIQMQMARLHEYRQALITAAVTGQLAIPEQTSI